MPSADDFFGIESSRRARTAFIAAPLIFLAIAAVLLGHPATREEARRWLFYENCPVEIVTFGFFLVGGISGLALAARARRWGLGALTVAFYVAYSVGLIFIAGEEVAWGQWFFHWATPEAWRAVNTQGETTLHNLPGLDDMLPALHVVFAVGALIGIQASRVRAFASLATPRVLGSWFLLVGVHSSLELVGVLFFKDSVFHKLFDRTSEVVEMYLAMAAWAYVFLNAKRLAREAGQTADVAPVVEASPSSRAAR